jgi:plasmid maintenance system antidote protein VapI
MEKETWLKQEIDRRGWKGREFARQIGRSPSHAHRLITGTEKPSVDLAREIARVFGVTHQEVLRKTGKLDPLPDDYDKAQEQELMEIFQGLSYSDRKMLIEFAQFLFSRDVDDDEENGEDEGD